jgi:hypothetical protein
MKRREKKVRRNKRKGKKSRCRSLFQSVALSPECVREEHRKEEGDEK